jgi:hypothetical protein
MCFMKSLISFLKLFMCGYASSHGVTIQSAEGKGCWYNLWNARYRRAVWWGQLFLKLRPSLQSPRCYTTCRCVHDYASWFESEASTSAALAL